MTHMTLVASQQFRSECSAHVNAPRKHAETLVGLDRRREKATGQAKLSHPALTPQTGSADAALAVRIGDIRNIAQRPGNRSVTECD